MNVIASSLGIKNPRWVDMPLKSIDQIMLALSLFINCCSFLLYSFFLHQNVSPSHFHLPTSIFYFSFNFPSISFSISVLKKVKYLILSVTLFLSLPFVFFSFFSLPLSCTLLFSSHSFCCFHSSSLLSFLSHN